MNYESMGADLSPCGKYRYTLERVWDRSKPTCTFIGLNPSTADCSQDDATIRRCVAFAKSWGCGKLIMVNLWPYRATQPAQMLRNFDSGDDSWADVFDRNMEVVLDAVMESEYSIAVWGNHGAKIEDTLMILERSVRFGLHHLARNKSGQPSHPLYLSADLRPKPFTWGKSP
jgi:hypothetical protein